jgi:hypothetical protein
VKTLRNPFHKCINEHAYEKFVPDYNYSKNLLSLILQWSLPNFETSGQLLIVGIQRPKQKESYNILEDFKSEVTKKINELYNNKKQWRFKLHFLQHVETCAAETYGKCVISRRNTQNITL